jgi:hypothetical protein
MVTFSESGAAILSDVVKGKALVISAESNEQFLEHTQELTVILEKLEILNGGNPMAVAQGNSMTLIIGDPSSTDGLAVNITGLFDFFGVTHTVLNRDEMVIGRANGFVYEPLSGEPVVFNKILQRYVTNDGSVLPKANNSTITPLASKFLKKLMPDYVARQEAAKANANTNIAPGSSVRIKSYQELKEQMGEACCVVDDSGNTSLVDAIGTEPYRFIKGIVYQQMAADVYDNKIATVEDIDYASGIVLLNIDGETVHNSFMVNGSIVKQVGASVDFTINMLEFQQ